MNRSLLLSLVTPLMLSQTGLAHAQCDHAETQVLIVSWDLRPAEANNIEAIVEGLGANGSQLADVPDDLSPYDVIFDIDVVTSLSADVRNRYEAFLAAGGGIYLTGEYPSSSPTSHKIRYVA